MKIFIATPVKERIMTLIKTVFFFCLMLAFPALSQEDSLLDVAVEDSVGKIVDTASATIISDCLRMENFPAGEYRINVEKADSLRYTGTITVGVNDSGGVTVELTPAAYITVMVKDHDDALILVNGMEVGQGSIDQFPVEAGHYEVSVEKEDFIPWKSSGSISQGDHTKLTAELISVFGSLTLTTEPGGARVFLNGNHAGKTPFINKQLKPGRYNVRLELDSYAPASTALNIENNKHHQREFTLERSQAWKDAVARFQKQKSYREWRWVRRVAFGTGAFLASGLGMHYDAQTSDAYNKYKATKGYDKAVHSANWNATEKKARTRNFCYGMAGILGAGCLISIPF
ncbi:MAG: PEGA domain-containing protein [Chitinispirillaceae bacterium]|nr:PEGA domain-containing protein [Chitinispirillaceae bacterium]